MERSKNRSVAGDASGSKPQRTGFAQMFNGARNAARVAAEELADRAAEFGSSTVDAVQGLVGDDPSSYEEAIVEYNGAFTAMNDKGVSLLRQRERSADLLALVERLINSIANTPKSFDTAFDVIELQRAAFLDAEEFARMDLEAARASAVGAGAGFTAGAAIASMAPTAAMWVATTFGAASTGTAISTLSGVAATNAALAWLGGGALAAGGGGTAVGGALLALAGPIGWTVAGAALLTSIVLFTKKRFETREAKHKALLALRENTATVQSVDAQIDELVQRSSSVRALLLDRYTVSMGMYGRDYLSLPDSQRSELSTLVNAALTCAELLGHRVVRTASDD